MQVIQVSPTSWLVATGNQGRYLITHMPAVNRQTGETHMMHRVDWWHIERDKRHTVRWEGDGLGAAVAWCRREIERPSFPAMIRGPRGEQISVEEQRRRWDAGLDPATGQPRDDTR